MTKWLASLVCLVSVTPGFGHEWYPPNCCSGGDCAPIHDDRVKPDNTGGYIVDNKFKVARNEVKDSQDGRYHACFPKPDELRCFFAPPSGS